MKTNMSSFVGFRATDELRKKMDSIANGNLSKFIRQAVELRLSVEENKNTSESPRGATGIFGETHHAQ